MNKLFSTKDAFYQSLVEIGKVVLKKRIFIFVNVFFLFCKYLPFENSVALYLKMLDIPYPRLLSAKFMWNWFWRRFFKFFNVFSLFCNYAPLGNGRSPSFEQNLISFTQGKCLKTTTTPTTTTTHSREMTCMNRCVWNIYKSYQTKVWINLWI